MNESIKQEHLHNSILGPRTEMYVSILCGIFMVTGFLLERFANLSSWFHLSCYVLAYFFGGYYAAIAAFNKIKKGGFDIDFLMIVAAIGAAYIGSWVEGALLLFLFSLGHALENYPTLPHDCIVW